MLLSPCFSLFLEICFLLNTLFVLLPAFLILGHCCIFLTLNPWFQLYYHCVLYLTHCSLLITSCSLLLAPSSLLVTCYCSFNVAPCFSPCSLLLAPCSRAQYEDMRDDLLGDAEQLEEEVGFSEIMIKQISLITNTTKREYNNEIWANNERLWPASTLEYMLLMIECSRYLI